MNEYPCTKTNLNSLFIYLSLKANNCIISHGILPWKSTILFRWKEKYFSKFIFECLWTFMILSYELRTSQASQCNHHFLFGHAVFYLDNNSSSCLLPEFMLITSIHPTHTCLNKNSWRIQLLVGIPSKTHTIMFLGFDRSSLSSHAFILIACNLSCN